jgi:PAS domain S-box-containing protein
VVLTADGTVERVIGGFQTPTVPRVTEDELRRSEAYLAAAQRMSHSGSWALNLSSRKIFWSQETFRIFGLEPPVPPERKVVLIDDFLQRIHPEDRLAIDQGIASARVQTESYEVEYRILLPDGSIRHVQEVVYPVTNDSGEVVERYGGVMDITERKRQEEQLRQSLDQLRALASYVQRAREDERVRVAREMHDDLGQALTAIKIEFSSLVRGLPIARKRQFNCIFELVDGAIESVRRICTELRPAILDELSLVAALQSAAAEFAARTWIRCRLDLPPGVIVINQECTTALFRIFQETLTNVARHANASEVNVRLAREDGNLVLEVRDNGKGFSEERLAGGSLGILGMRERVLLVAGEFTITGGPGKGTTVRVRIPERPPARTGTTTSNAKPTRRLDFND